MKPEMQNRRLDPRGLAKHGETRGLTGTGPGLAHQESPGGVLGRLENRTDPFLWSKPRPLVGYPYPLLTLQGGHIQKINGTRTSGYNIVIDLAKRS